MSTFITTAKSKAYGEAKQGCEVGIYIVWCAVMFLPMGIYMDYPRLHNLNESATHTFRSHMIILELAMAAISIVFLIWHAKAYPLPRPTLAARRYEEKLGKIESSFYGYHGTLSRSVATHSEKLELLKPIVDALRDFDPGSPILIYAVRLYTTIETDLGTHSEYLITQATKDLHRAFRKEIKRVRFANQYPSPETEQLISR